MSIRKPLDRSRIELSTSKKTQQSRLSPFARSVFEQEESRYTPERHPVDRGEYTVTRPKERLANNLNYKIDSIIKHNSHLLDENSKLMELVRDKESQIQIMQTRLQLQLQEEANNLNLIDAEKNRILMQVQSELLDKDRQVDALIRQVETLTDEIQLREAQYKDDVRKLGDELYRESQSKIDNLKRSQTHNMDIYEVQIQKLKDFLLTKEQQLEEQSHRHLVTERRLEEEVRILTSQLKHANERRIMDSEETKLHHETQLAEVIREGVQRRDIESRNYENAIKRVKKELAQKTLENERINFRLQQTITQNKAEYGFIQQEKAKVQFSMVQMQLRGKEIRQEEKSKLAELAEAQLQNLQVCHSNLLNALQLQKAKLLEINQLKSLQIVRLSQQMDALREANQSMATADSNLIKYLQQKLNSVQSSYQQELQLLKIKMAHLHSGDVDGLINSYENQVSSLGEQISELEAFAKQNRQKLHAQLLQKTQMRKHFEIEISKLENKNGQLKRYLEKKGLEMRESIEDIRSKHEISSETFIREVTTTKKDVEKRDSDIRKCQELVNAKDIQIQQLNELIRSLKDDFQQHIKQKDEQIEDLNTINQELKREQKKEKDFYEKELKRKVSSHKEEKDQLEEELHNVKSQTYEELMNELEQVQKEKLRLEGEIMKERLDKDTISKSQKTHKQIAEYIRLESSAALEQQKEGHSRKMTLEQGKLKKFYQQQLKSKGKQIQELKARLSEKDTDIRGTENKVADFQKKLQTMVQGHNKLRELEVKTVNLGMDNNVLKNTSQLFKNKYR